MKDLMDETVTSNTMDLSTAIFNRRSIRIYDKDRVVSKEKIEKIIEAGVWAPSACNVQGWKFIVIEEKVVFDEIIKHGAAAFLQNTQQAILVIYDNRSDNLEYNDYIQSGSACIENMLLMAHAMNIGTCWINNLPPKKKLKQILNIPWNYEPIALISLGYCSQKINPRKRKYELSDLISYNKYSFEVEARNEKYLKLVIRRVLRKIYNLLPYKQFFTKIVDQFEKKFDN